ncbi:M23 family metallopeptidase [Actinopolymorpha alba]|uniref:M23 family metallopeptidase n=1 Tax=Actinopolymorpha alba TaxID=533267 RepID=UPI00035C9116|nr:M23 family metallopeptidase [Actinopolymorpha alba]
MVRHFPPARSAGESLDTNEEQLPDEPDGPARAGPGRLTSRRKRRRLRLGGSVLVLAVAVTLGGLAPAQAGPEEDKRRVEREIDGAKGDLDESSAQLIGSTKALQAAETKLAAARAKLATVRGQLSAARAKDAAMAAKLARAERDVAQATAAVAAAEDRVRTQRDEIGAFANASYQQSGLGELAAVLKSETPAELLGRVHIVASVSESQRTALNRMNAARADLAATRAALQAAEKLVAQQRKEAADNLARVRVLERQARESEAAVEGLVADRQAAQDAAEKAKQEDLRRYKELVAERERIEAQLKEIARKEAEEERKRRERRRDDGGGGGGGGDPGSSLSRPVSAPITSPYGMRFHPVLKRWKLHDGTDFGAACGTPIRAAASGKVISRYFNAGYGNRVLISHGWLRGASVVTAYNHLSAYAVSSGQQVSKGDIIGYVGTTGYSTGCHLHFMVYRNGSTVDPMNYL